MCHDFFFFLNEVLAIEAMAKCWRNDRPEHLITTSQDTYGFFFFRLKSSIKEHTDMIRSQRSANQLGSMASRRSQDFPPLFPPNGGKKKSSSSRSGVWVLCPRFTSTIKTIGQTRHGCSQRNNFCGSSLKCTRRATRRSLKIDLLCK